MVRGSGGSCSAGILYVDKLKRSLKILWRSAVARRYWKPEVPLPSLRPIMRCTISMTMPPQCEHLIDVDEEP